jgi:hypothetical protein
LTRWNSEVVKFSDRSASALSSATAPWLIAAMNWDGGLATPELTALTADRPSR